MPHKSLDTFFFWNSGAEAVEAAVKLARHATKKQNIIAMQGSYHGRTFGTMALTKSKTVYGEGYAPLMPGVFAVPFPYCAQCSISHQTDGKYGYENCCMDPILQLELLLKRETAPSDTAAIIIETVLGEGGYVPPPAGYLAKVREICDKNNILLIADEVQCGFGRTGKMFAIEHWDVRPDILVMAKGIANGFPLSGIVSRKELMVSIQDRTFSQTILPHFEPTQQRPCKDISETFNNHFSSILREPDTICLPIILIAIRTTG